MGISEVVYNQGYLVDTKTAAIFAESGVRLRQFVPPREGLVDLSLGIAPDATEDFNGKTSVGDVREVLDDGNFVRPIQ